MDVSLIIVQANQELAEGIRITRGDLVLREVLPAALQLTVGHLIYQEFHE